MVGSGTVKADIPGLDVRLEELEDRSPQPVVLGKADVPEHWRRLSEPAEIGALENTNWLMVEGGATTAASFLKDDLVDRLILYRAPIVIGGGLPSIGDIGLGNLAEAHDQWELEDRRFLGNDVVEIYNRAA